MERLRLNVGAVGHLAHPERPQLPGSCHGFEGAAGDFHEVAALFERAAGDVHEVARVSRLRRARSETLAGFSTLLRRVPGSYLGFGDAGESGELPWSPGLR